MMPIDRSPDGSDLMPISPAQQVTRQMADRLPAEVGPLLQTTANPDARGNTRLDPAAVAAIVARVGTNAGYTPEQIAAAMQNAQENKGAVIPTESAISPIQEKPIGSPEQTQNQPISFPGKTIDGNTAPAPAYGLTAAQVASLHPTAAAYYPAAPLADPGVLSNLPAWVYPAAIAGGAVLLLLLLMRRR